jgi:hypothetical protein
VSNICLCTHQHLTRRRLTFLSENEAEILRRNCVATKMLSVYARWKGFAYLQGTLHKVLERLMLTSQDLDLELDPTRVGTQEELEKNALQLQIVAKVFMDDICASASNIPPSFRKICSIVSPVKVWSLLVNSSHTINRFPMRFCIAFPMPSTLPLALSSSSGSSALQSSLQR